jgi:L-ascorbate metabolism protein UlaG (beta-lactamase superfamily)
MRLKLGRPELRDYARYFDVPSAEPGAPLTVTWAGVTTLLIDDGESALMTDGFFSRPSLLEVALRPMSPSAPRIDGCLARIGVDRLEAVLPVHTHYDHAMDSAMVAERTGARVVGGTSAAQIGRGHGLSEDRVVVVTPGEPITLGAYDVTLIEAEHCPPDRFPGVITEPVVPPVKVSAYKCGEAWSTLVHHRPSDRRLLIVGSAGFVRGALAGKRAEVVYLGIGQLGLQPEQYLVDYWTETVRAVGARRVVLIHWDDFFRPLHKPLRALPYAGDDLDVSMRCWPRWPPTTASRCICPRCGSAPTRGSADAVIRRRQRHTQPRHHRAQPGRIVGDNSVGTRLDLRPHSVSVIDGPRDHPEPQRMCPVVERPVGDQLEPGILGSQSVGHRVTR